jgi:anti-sigma factor RsiW
MQHLMLEALARLVDEPPSGEERAHLEACDACRSELEAMVEDRRALAALPDLIPGPDGWPALRARLAREGLLRERRFPAPALARAAAATLLFLAGSAAGYAVRGPAGDPGPGWAGRVAVEEASPPGAPATTLTADATRDVEAAGELFMAALDRYMASSQDHVPDPAARLAALDNIVLTTAEALHEAPADPIINSYHLTALAQRNAVLRQLAAGGGQPVF